MWWWDMADPFDGPEIATLVASVIAAVGVVVAAWLGKMANKNAKEAREQVQNGHGTNLRTDVDDIKGVVDAIDRGQIHVIRELAAVKGKVNLLEAGFQYNREDIDDLMDTAGKKRQQEQWAEPRPGTRRARRLGNV